MMFRRLLAPPEATGYGIGDGLCGWNCRHNFFPFFEGIDLRTYRDEDLEKLKDWIKEKELTSDPARVQVNGFGRSVSQKAFWANKKALQNTADGGTIKMNDSDESLHPITEKALDNNPRVTAFASERINRAVEARGIEILSDLINDPVGTEETNSIRISDLSYEKRKGECYSYKA